MRFFLFVLSLFAVGCACHRPDPKPAVIQGEDPYEVMQLQEEFDRCMRRTNAHMTANVPFTFGTYGSWPLDDNQEKYYFSVQNGFKPPSRVRQHIVLPIMYSDPKMYKLKGPHVRLKRFGGSILIAYEPPINRQVPGEISFESDGTTFRVAIRELDKPAPPPPPPKDDDPYEEY